MLRLGLGGKDQNLVSAFAEFYFVQFPNFCS